VVTGGTGSTVTFASFTEFGAGCAGSTPIPAPPCQQWNEAGGLLSNTTSADEVVLRVSLIGAHQIESFDVFTSSVSGASVTVPARLYVGNTPGAAPIATTSITVGGTAAFYRATFASPVPVNSACYIGIDTSALDVYVPTLTIGQFNVAYSRPNNASPWAVQVLRPSFIVNCTPDFQVPLIGNTGRPVLGSSFDVDIAAAKPAAFAVLVQGLSNQAFNGIPLPIPIPGAPGCDLLVSADVTELAFTNSAGAASRTVTVPNTTALEGLEVFYQWVVRDLTANNIGLVSSDAGRALLGL
jgi:hypothetical protein